MTIAEAIEEFRKAAVAKADGAIPASLDRALHACMAQAFHFLNAQGQDGLAAFAGLLCDESPHVRSWVATQLLSVGELAAVPVLEQLAAAPGNCSQTAAMTLKEFQAGRLRSPFATSDS